MGEAILCDRCGAYSYKEFSIGGRHILDNVPHEYHYPEEQDLCVTCGNELREIIKTWWRKDLEKPREE